MSGASDTIVCTWRGDDVHRLEWFIEGLDSLPIATETGTNTLVLAPDASTSGLNGTNFTCRATTTKGDQFEQTVSLHVKGLGVLTTHGTLCSIIDGLSLISDITVSISASPSLPYYQPASHIRIDCNVEGATGPVSYLWTTTSNNLYFRQRRQTRSYIVIDRLTVPFAGNYTCSVTDSDGFVVNASIAVKLNGELSNRLHV